MRKGNSPKPSSSPPLGRKLRLSTALLSVLVLLAPARGMADEWLVYLGGGLEAVEGGWDQRHGQVIFKKLGGTLVSIPYAEVDLATSAFITWQLGGRREAPPRIPLPEPAAGDGSTESPPCITARLLRLRNAETLEVLTGKGQELVHVACLDAPETAHKFAELGWFGRAAVSAVELGLEKGDEICLTEHVPAIRDAEGHRVVYVTLKGGRDYTAGVIGGGLGLLRSESCSRAAFYRSLEDRAIAKEQGLWGQIGVRPAFTAAQLTAAVAAGPAPPRAKRQGGG